MIKFVISGQIPGTQIQLTFSTLLVIAAATIIAYELAKVVRKKSNLKTLK